MTRKVNKMNLYSYKCGVKSRLNSSTYRGDVRVVADFLSSIAVNVNLQISLDVTVNGFMYLVPLRLTRTLRGLHWASFTVPVNRSGGCDLRA